MSTLRLSVVLLILLVLLGLVGCTSTSAYRTAEAAPKMRTVATIGDKPLPTVTGEPGKTVSAEAEPLPERRTAMASEGQISGRVVDAQGDPVAGARVRMAVGATPGGRLIRSTTDRGGGFTLRGLRPGTPYTLIAEWEDDQGVLTGRSNVKAPDSDVRIALDSDASEPRASGTSKRVDPVSRRDVSEEDVMDIVGSPINVEDLPPAPEAEVIAPGSRRRPHTETGSGESFATQPSGGWHPSQRSRPAVANRNASARGNVEDLPQLESEPILAPTASPSREGRSPFEVPSHEDDGPNPLPPALEPGETSLRAPGRQQEEGGKDAFVAPVQQTTVLALADVPAPLPDLPPGAMVPSTPTLPPPTDLPPPAEQAPESRPPGAVASQDPPALLPPPVEANVAELVAPPPAPFPAQTDPGSEPEFPGDPSRPRPKWRDLAGTRVDPPLRESGVRGSPKEPDSFCRYDSKHRRIEDFRLPDLQGRLVRFQDFDADLILLDFWGSWCQPCLRSVPHLIDLQKRLGGKQLQVVGIACERAEAPQAERVAGAAKAAQKLGINYPILVASMDGSCPLQKALHVQAYPTMILVDRQGRVLWQDQGATRLTMVRLDRMISIATKSDGRRRY